MGRVTQLRRRLRLRRGRAIPVGLAAIAVPLGILALATSGWARGIGPLRVNATADAQQANAGSPIGFTFSVTNAGSSALQQVALSGPLPTGTDLTWSVSPSYSGPGTCSIATVNGGQVLHCNIGKLPGGATTSVHVTSSTSNASCGTYTVTVTASAAHQSLVSASATTTVACPPPPTPTTTPTAVESATPLETPTPSAVASATPFETPTPSAVESATPFETPTPTAFESPTPFETPTPTALDTPTP
jgi:uncharacterized repeat protein (TIGR01451 family)